jgi:hypothetical protein
MPPSPPAGPPFVSYRGREVWKPWELSFPPSNCNWLFMFESCRYEVVLPDQTQVSMTVGAQKGQVYVMGAATPRSQWDQFGDSLRRCAESFRLINR